MELIVKKLGRLKEARLDIKPLTVFVGPNHTNKTWTAYSLYGIARNLSRIEFATRRSFGFAAGAALRARIDSVADDLLRKLTGKPAQEAAATVGRDEACLGVNGPGPSFSIDAPGLAAVLGIPESRVAGAGAWLGVTPDEFTEGVYSAVEVVYRPAELELEWRFIRADGTPQPHPYRLGVSTRGGNGADGSAADANAVLKERLVDVIGMLAHTLFDDVAVLPAERKTLLSFDRVDFYHSSLAYAREPAFAAPIYDFMYMVDAARRLRKAPAARPQFPLDLAKVLRDKIIGGGIEFEDEDRSNTSGGTKCAGVGRQLHAESHGSLTYVTSDGVDLAIHAAASIVRSLAGLDICLKDYCDRGGLLVIDEPEMNAHPEAQLKIIEFLALLASYGVRVVLTTHSPYIVDHLSNLMQASRLSAAGKNAVAPRFRLGKPEAFLTPHDVSVYLFNESGEVDDILDHEQCNIDLASFSRPTEYMANLVNEIWKAVDDQVSETVEHGNAV
jgi:hypothetical protein